MPRKRRAAVSPRARKRHQFTPEECRRGYARALEVMMERGWDAYAWFFRHIRASYRQRRKA